MASPTSVVVSKTRANLGPRLPSRDVVRAFGRLVSTLIRPLGAPGEILVGRLTTGQSFEGEVMADLASFDEAVTRELDRQS